MLSFCAVFIAINKYTEIKTNVFYIEYTSKQHYISQAAYVYETCVGAKLAKHLQHVALITTKNVDINFEANISKYFAMDINMTQKRS